MTAVEQELSLADLADIANAEYKLVVEASEEAGDHLSRGLQHAIKAGEALLEAQARFRRGEWSQWLVENIDSDEATARLFMRYAHNKHLLLSAEMPLTTATASRFLAGLPQAETRLRAGLKLSGDRLREARRARKAGLTFKDIAELLDVAPSTVQRALDPAYRQRTLAAAKLRKRVLAQQGRDAREKRRQEANAAAVRAAGLDKLYTDLRKFALQLDATIRDHSDRGVRTTLSEARTSLAKVEDAIVRASRVSS